MATQNCNLLYKSHWVQDDKTDFKVCLKDVWIYSSTVELRVRKIINMLIAINLALYTGKIALSRAKYRN